MDNRDEILINFQAITGLEDLATCLEILEQKEWDLASAVNSVLPQPDFQYTSLQSSVNSVLPQPVSQSHSDDHDSSKSSESSNGTSRPVGFIDLTASPSTSVSFQDQAQSYIDVESYSSMRSSSSIVMSDFSLKGRLCELRVQYDAKLVTIYMQPAATVAQVKHELESRTGVLTSTQVLSGWQFGSSVSDLSTLESIGMSGGVCYHLMLNQVPQSLTSSRYNSPPILPPHSLSFGPTTFFTPSLEGAAHGSTQSMPALVLEKVTHGLRAPVSTTNHSVGGEELPGLFKDPSTEERNLVQSPVVVSSPSSSSHFSDAVQTISSEDDEAQDGLESFDDTLFDDDSSASPTAKAMKEPLIPKGCLEPYEALQFFLHAFEARYGAMHPLFLIGTLSDAVNEATAGNATSGTRKPMFVYLHHDASVLSNIFCSQLLCSESVVNYLSNNFISWAWDLTLHESRIKLLQMVEECFGKVAKSDVDEIRADHLPAILIAYKVKGSTEIRNIIQGETNIDSLMTTLIMGVEDHNLNIEKEAMEERERLLREHMIAEQNKAYQDSLTADREKAKQREEEELAQLERKQQEEQEKQNREEQREAMEICVPDEPLPDCVENMCTLRIRYPDGSQGQRRFLAKHQLQDLLHFLGSQGYLVSDYKILTSFPRKDLTDQNPDETFEEANLCPQETIFVEEK